MRVVVAPYFFSLAKQYITCFLAGGITNCWVWQEEVINELKSYSNTDTLVVMNPRRPNFPIDDPNAAAQQISWEFYWLERCDIFSMYFAASEQSDQPICMYELGRNVIAMQHRFPESYMSRIVLGCENGYRRETDVKTQMNLALGQITISTTPEEHAKRIIEAYHKLLKA